MESYQFIAEKLIMARDVDDAFAKEHIVFDFLNGDIWLDLEVLYFYKDILEGFVNKEEYEQFLECVQAEENIRGIQRQALALYQDKSIFELLKTIWNERKSKHLFPSEAAISIRWSLMELLSRTRLPKIYYYITNLPIRIKLNLTAKVIKYRLATQGYK
jgi:hypothetical protein